MIAAIANGCRAKALLVPCIAAAGLTFSGCNQGGDTSCSTFRGKSFAAQKKVIANC